MRTGRGVIGLLLLVIVVMAAVVVAEPAAVVVQTAGKVELQRAGRTLPVAVGTSLEVGDRLVVPAGGKAVMMYRTGKMETATSTITIQARESEQVGNLYRQTVQTIVQVATTDAAKQANRQGMIRPVAGMPSPIAPRNEIRVLDVRPTFTWNAVTGGTRYTVQVLRTDLPGARPLRFDAGADTVWTYPATEPALVPGASYQWTVATAEGRPAAPQKFRIITPEELGNVTSLLSAVSESGLDPMGDGLFLAALFYRDAGLFYEADRALARIAASGGGTGRTFHLLRGEVFDAIGDLEAASRAFQAADAEPGA